MDFSLACVPGKLMNPSSPRFVREFKKVDGTLFGLVRLRRDAAVTERQERTTVGCWDGYGKSRVPKFPGGFPPLTLFWNSVLCSLLFF